MSDPNDEDDWDDIETKKTVDVHLDESRVGKKLSKTTTRRVIVLVLTMLLVLPFLRAQSADNYPSSSYYGADEVWTSWKEKRDRPTWGEGLERYEKSLLKYIYYHNWFVGRSDFCEDAEFGCSSWYFSHVFWTGLTSTDESQVSGRVNSTRLRLSAVQEYQEYAKNQQDIYRFGSMPQEVLPAIAGEWTACNSPDKGIFRRGFSLIGKEIDGLVGYAAPCPGDLRNVEKAKFYPRLLTSTEHEEWHFAFYFDMRLYTQTEAFFGICITVFVCVVLCVNALYFSNDANKLVLRPLEKMIKRVDAIRSDPLIAMQMADEEFKLEMKERAKMNRQSTIKNLRRCLQPLKNCSNHGTHQRRETEGVLETVVLEKTIIKLGSLLALGFGEAGASIIGHNLACSDSAGVNVMIPGRHVEAIVGKARINDFSIATEVLQARVMTFVNQIAEIIHGVVNEFHGCANKNNGDTFLLIWRTSGGSESMASRFADMACMAFAKILGAVHRAPVLAAYRAHPRLQQRLGTNTRVNLTFGLHSGWAIEGAVGSEFKIDASYLSPNVSLASSIEAATKVYKVPILVSQDVVDHQGAMMSDKCRLIDRVLMKGSASPMRLYSLDLDYLALTVDAPRNPNMKWNLRERFKVRQFLEVEKQRKFEVEMWQEFDASRDICNMRRRYNTGFLQMFHMGFQNYVNGEWQVAKRLLSNANDMLHGADGPSIALLEFMKLENFTAPASWQGIREL